MSLSVMIAPRRKTLIFLGFIVFVAWLLSDRISELLCSSSSSPWCSPQSYTAGSSQWNLFYHLGGNGPWIPKRDGLGHPEDPLPAACSVDQVHMLSRHAERYPTQNAGGRHLGLLGRLNQPNVKLRGSLAFLNKWTYFTDPAEPSFENLTTHGPYAGTVQARTAGKTFRRRYSHLVHKDRPTKFWTCETPRDIESANCFADGFFGAHWESDGSAKLEIISEDPNQGGNTLTPGDTCYAYRNDILGHDFGYLMLEKWQNNFTAPITDRLRRDAVGASLSPLDIYGMMEMCGFEVLARGHSAWCDVFTRQEWLEFEYARDLLHFYRAGPGNQYGPVMGWLYLNATADLLVKEDARDVYFSFVHDGDLVPMLAALQIFDEKTVVQELPTDRVKPDRQWVTSDVVPMGGRVVFERIACWEQDQRQRYVRVFINDGLMKLPGFPSSSTLKHGVPVEDFWVYISSRPDLFGDFRTVCELLDGVPDRITFLHQNR
jgi:acid phosphatase